MKHEPVFFTCPSCKSKSEVVAIYGNGDIAALCPKCNKRFEVLWKNVWKKGVKYESNGTQEDIK